LNGADNIDCALYTCGTLLTLANNDPKVNGFVGGKYLDGSIIFAGAGNFSMCYNLVNAPGRVMTNSSSFIAGTYSSCLNAPKGFNIDSQNSKYFYKHSDLKWVPTTAAAAASVVGAVKVGIHYVGRKFMTSSNGTYVQVDKIENGLFRYHIPGTTIESTFSGEIDVLACVPCATGSGPFCCLNGANNKDCILDKDLPCGATKPFPRNDPNVDGFLSGTYQDSSKVFPGTGDFSA
jgi:hypothetical protein